MSKSERLPRLPVTMSGKGKASNSPKVLPVVPQQHSPEAGASDEVKSDESILIILVLLAFLAVALILFGSGWLQVNV